MHTGNEPNEGDLGRFAAAINGQVFHFRDPVPSTRQLLDAASFTPADDCILIQDFGDGTRAVGLDETVDLRRSGTETFWAFRSDRVFRFTVNERGFDWGERDIKEPTLRTVARVPEAEVLVLEREDDPDRELGPDDEVHLGHAGTEHLRIASRLITVFFKDVPYEIPRGVHTTEQLMAKFPIEEGFLLNLKTEDGVLETLKPGERIRVKEGMQFYSQAPCGGSS